MPKFAKAETQAENVVKGLTKARIIKSYGTARNYDQTLKTVAKWTKENKWTSVAHTKYCQLLS